MTYSGQFLKVEWLFTVDHTDEIADTGINYTSAPGWSGAEAALAELKADGGVGLDLLGAYNDFMGNADIMWADYSKNPGIKISAKDTAGHDLVDPYIYQAGVNGGVSNNIPPQCTVVLSLRSGFTLGGGNYGRMYLPHTVMSLSPGYPIAASATRDSAAVNAKTFVNLVTSSLDSVTTATVFPAIMSQGSGPGVSPVRAPSGKGVTQVAVGGVVDTQRRRRNNIPEVYSFQSL